MKHLRTIAFLLVILCAAAPLFAKPVKRHPATGLKDRYIVMYHSATPAEAVDGLSRSLAITHGLDLLTIWGNVKGFLCEAPIEAVTALAQDPRIELVEQDHIMRGPTSGTVSTNTPFTQHILNEDRWYLDRLDEFSWAGGTRDHTYEMCPDAANATAYIIDEAVWKDHDAFSNTTVTTIDCTRDFERDHSGQPITDPRTGRLKPLCVSRDAANACKNDILTRGIFLDQVHGTAVASLLAGKDTGAARPEIVSVNIFPCEPNLVGPTDPSKITRASYVIAAIDWIKGDITARKNVPNGFKPSVINHSGYVVPWDTEAAAVLNAVRDIAGTGVPYFTSADNFSGDSCQFTPNSLAYTRNTRHWTRVAFVVGGSSMKDQNGTENPLAGSTDIAWQIPRSVWDPPGAAATRRVLDTGTNLGDCVSAFAPAVKIIAATHGATAPVTDHYREMGSGSSWSSPLVAAIALRWMVTQWTQGQPIPNLYQTYNKLLDDAPSPTNPNPPNPGFAGPAPQSLTNTSYRICYNPNDSNDWLFESSTVTPCPMSNVNPGVQLEPFDMPQATNSSDARIVTWTSTCPSP